MTPFSIMRRLLAGAGRLNNQVSDWRGDFSDSMRVLGGFIEYRRDGRISDDTRRALLRRHCRTNGVFCDRLAGLLRLVRPARPAGPATGLLGTFSAQQQNEIAADIARDGYYVFRQRLPEDLCEEISAFAARTPAQVEGGSELKLFDPDTPVSKTYRIREEDSTRNRAMQRLMADPALLAIAERYLGFAPILSMVNLWWSATFGDKPGDAAAQEFHFDFDPPPHWLLFFVYLTDVGPDNGPHVYVRGSHRGGVPEAAELLKRGYVRIPDAEIAERFGGQNVVELHGRRGTVLAVDTRGFHKGKMLTDGHRLMAQLTYSSPTFSGAHGAASRLGNDVDPALKAAFEATPQVYTRYL